MIKDKVIQSDVDRILDSKMVQEKINAFIRDNKGKRVFFYGAGRLAKKLMDKFNFSLLDIGGFIDANKAKTAETINGHRIYHTGDIADIKPEVIAVTVQNKLSVLLYAKFLKDFSGTQIVHDLFDESEFGEGEGSFDESLLDSPFFQEKIDFMAEKYKGKNVYLYGSGDIARKFVEKTNLSGFSIVGFVDADPQKVGTKTGNYEVFSIDKFREVPPDIILPVEDTEGNDLFKLDIERQTGKTLDKIEHLHKQRYSFVSYYLQTCGKEFTHKLKIADVGCGAGYGSYIMANSIGENLDKIDSFDISDAALSFARQHYSNDKITFRKQNCTAEELSQAGLFKDSKYDVITCFEFLEHLDIDESQKLLSLLLEKSDILITSFPIDNTSPYHQIMFSTEEIETYYNEGIRNCPVKKKISARFIQQEKFYVFVIENSD